MKTREVDHTILDGLRFGAEENSGAENAPEGFDDAPIMPTVFRQVKEIEDLGSRLKPDDAALLPNRQRGDPNWNQAILAVRQSEFGMSDNMKKEFSISPAVDLLV
jgi:hypothetical protein